MKQPVEIAVLDIRGESQIAWVYQSVKIPWQLFDLDVS
jgi:hypothetical protein